MQITRLDQNALLLSGIDAVLADLLRNISTSADPGGDTEAHARLFSSPTSDPAEQELTEDWQEFVQPELAKLFQSALQVIDSDLQKMRIDLGTGESAIVVPEDHLENWIHGLNQARLVLSTQFNFGEEEMERTLPLGGDPRSIALLKVRFYGFIQELFLRQLEDG